MTDAGLVVGGRSTVVVDDGRTGAVVTTGDEPSSMGTAPSVAAVAVHAVTTSTAPASSGTDRGHLVRTGQVHRRPSTDASHTRDRCDRMWRPHHSGPNVHVREFAVPTPFSRT
jgi:hypothetical protein